MDPSILVRLLPAMAVAVLVGRSIEHPVRGRLATGEVVDEVLRVLVVALVAGRLAWLVLGGPEVWRSALRTAILVRGGVDTGLGLLVAAWWVGRHDDGDRSWRVRAAVPAGLAGLAAWHALCEVDGVCGGNPVSWGIRLPERAVPVFPTEFVLAVVALAAAGLAWRAVRAGRVELAWGLGVGYAVGRVGLGFTRPALTSHPTRDQLAFVLVALVGAWFVARVIPSLVRPGRVEGGVEPVGAPEEPS